MDFFRITITRQDRQHEEGGLLRAITFKSLIAHVFAHHLMTVPGASEVRNFATTKMLVFETFTDLCSRQNDPIIRYLSSDFSSRYALFPLEAICVPRNQTPWRPVAACNWRTSRIAL